MTHDDDHVALDVLTRAVAEALDRKRRLGQYYVVSRDGRAVCIGPDARWRGPDDGAAVDRSQVSE